MKIQVAVGSIDAFGNRREYVYEDECTEEEWQALEDAFLAVHDDPLPSPDVIVMDKEVARMLCECRAEMQRAHTQQKG